MGRCGIEQENRGMINLGTDLYGAPSEEDRDVTTK